ncbi:hypothetical protein GE09DRAFT_968594 [Coniochaeta sp. 2T2.1]|nr:hypothetical protein GE09DRAFT_968594 [Coniochaeta sp. 2T2.1]
MKYNNTGLHQARASDGSLIFGALNSNTTSPVPIGGGAQPPTSMPHVPAVTAVAHALDGFGRPLIASPAFEGFPADAFPQPGFHPTHNHHGPPTPHSFHGSQASVHADENGYPTYPPANGQTAYPGQPGGQAHRHMPTMSMDPQSGVHYSLSSGPMFSQLQAGTLQFLQSSAENAEFSDCTLELRLSTPVNQPGNRDAPLLVPCHRFILARSPILSEMLHSRSIPAGGRLVLELERDEIMRPDSFHFTLRTLYGWDLPEYPSGLLPSYHPQHSMKESFDITLGYLAAAKYLKLPYVYAKAMPHACHQLHWETIEKACQFALPSVVLAQPQSPRHKMGADKFNPSALVEAIIAFLVHEMPTDFVLDTNAGRCCFDRLPPSGSYEPRHAGPVVANGTSGPQIPESRGQPASHANMPRHPRVSGNPRLSSIQFGDLSLMNGGQNMANGQIQRQRQSSDIHSTLSRILVNLPFFMLKKILEHPGLALDPQSRVSLTSAVITEREARRFSVLNSGAPEFQVYVHRLETAPEPLVVQQIGDFYVNSLGFKEEVFPGEGPYLVQTWINGSGRTNS